MVDLKFHLKVFKLKTTVCSLWITKFHTSILYRPWILPFHTISCYILCIMCMHMHHKTLYMHIGLLQLFCRQDNPYVPCSAATKVHNVTDTPTYKVSAAPIASAYKTDHICHAQ